MGQNQFNKEVQRPLSCLFFVSLGLSLPRPSCDNNYSNLYRPHSRNVAYLFSFFFFFIKTKKHKPETYKRERKLGASPKIPAPPGQKGESLQKVFLSKKRSKFLTEANLATLSANSLASLEHHFKLQL